MQNYTKQINNGKILNFKLAGTLERQFEPKNVNLSSKLLFINLMCENLQEM